MNHNWTTATPAQKKAIIKQLSPEMISDLTELRKLFNAKVLEITL